jgi:hypothetical protein
VEARESGRRTEAASTCGPDVSAILKIHRHQDGVITFHKLTNDDDDMEHLFAFQAQYLDGKFPEIHDRLTTDSYFSLNAYYYEERGPHYLPAARIRHRGQLRYLCSCFCDLDCYNAGLSPAETLSQDAVLVHGLHKNCAAENCGATHGLGMRLQSLSDKIIHLSSWRPCAT